MVTHVTHFEKVAVFSRSARSKVRTEENVETVERQMEDKSQLSLRQLSQQTELSVSTCERIVRKDLEDSVTAERYRNNILDVFTVNSYWLKGIFNKTGLQHARLFVICGNFLHLCCLMNRSLPMCIEAQGYHF
jgi:4-hydroxy-3-methylbut-2-enyl diphosphate reductase IspH